jgi:predicted Rossmann fold flavoprotein
MAMERVVDVVVLGAGAAGMMCAFEAGRRGRRVLLLDHGDKVGRKILISGGGRCNFTNVHAKAENYLSENPHFARSAMARFTPAEFIALVEKHGIRYHEKTLGQLFCDESARQIVTMLERECAEAKVETRCGVTISTVRRSEEGFVVETNTVSITCEAVVIATGGLSIPKLGATAFGYELAKQFGHSIIEPRAGLVPLVFGVEDCESWCDLSGLAFDVAAKAEAETQRRGRTLDAPAFRERLLITHRGISGPAVLQASSYWRTGGDVSFDIAPDREVFAPLLAKSSERDWNTAYAALKQILPTRMAERWIRIRADKSAGDWTNAGIAKLERELHAWTVRPDGSEGFAKAEVTVGGVNTGELDARTMESRLAKGLYFIGEVVDVTGWLGGYNFQWAWASAAAAGRSV